MSVEQDELLAAAMQGQQTALERLLLANYDKLAQCLRSRMPVSLQATVDVEDILQVTFIHVFRDFSTFKGKNASAFQAWLRTIADARRVDAIREAKRKKRGGDHKRFDRSRVSASQSVVVLLALISETPSQIAATHEAVEALLIAIQDLPDDQHEAIWLRYIENLTLAEVAETMGRTDDAVRGLLDRGKKALNKAMGNSSAWFSKVE